MEIIRMGVDMGMRGRNPRTMFDPVIPRARVCVYMGAFYTGDTGGRFLRYVLRNGKRDDNNMKRRFVGMIAAMMICLAGSAMAGSIRLTNGPVTLTAVPFGGDAETAVPMGNFAIAGAYEDGSYLVGANGKVYVATPEAMDKAVMIDLSVVDVPVIGDE